MENKLKVFIDELEADLKHHKNEMKIHAKIEEYGAAANIQLRTDLQSFKLESPVL